MTLSLFDSHAPATQSALAPQATTGRGAWKLPLRRALGLTRPVHALLADAHGVWAWEPRDCHAPATRHASISAWMARHPGCDLRLWVSAELARSLVPASAVAHAGPDLNVDQNAVNAPDLRVRARHELVRRYGAAAQSWALATWYTARGLGVCALSGIDLAALTRAAHAADVRIRAVVPWWYHAFSQATHCVSAIHQAPMAQVCVVEGQQVAWVSATYGVLADVQQTVLADACVDALRDALLGRTQQANTRCDTSVVLGQGLRDGAHTHTLDALVLGRLDGAQPPQWLRPSLQREIH